MLTSIEGRSDIVTGASRGNGIARVFAAKGARVPIAVRDPGQAEWQPLRFVPRRIRFSGMRVISPNLLNCRDADECSRLISQHAEVLQLLKELGSPIKTTWIVQPALISFHGIQRGR